MNAPAILVALTNTIYWIAVTVKAIRHTLQTGRQPNIIPRETLGLVLRLIWLPVIVGMLSLSWGYARHVSSATMTAYWGALVAILALAFTFHCWSAMGAQWRMGINPKEKTTLVTTGPFGYSAHPIYSLSMILAIATLMAVPTAPMVIVVSLQIILLYQEASREEQDMLQKHGQAYLDYQSKVGRFFPRWR